MAGNKEEGEKEYVIRGRNMESKRHHIIPSLCLQYFVDPESKSKRRPKSGVWVYEKGCSKPELKSIRKTGCLFKYYSFEKKDGSDFGYVENILSQIESKVGDIFVKLCKKDFNLTDSEKETMGEFLGTLHMRVPYARKGIKLMEEKLAKKDLIELAKSPKFDEFVKKHLANTEFKDYEDYDKLRDFALSGNYDICSPIERTLLYVLDPGISFGKYLYRMSWAYKIAEPGSAFFISDVPMKISSSFSNHEPIYAGIDYDDAYVTFPITKDVCLVMTYHDNDKTHKTIKRKEVWEINKRTIKDSTAIYSSKKLSKLEQKAIGMEIKKGQYLWGAGEQECWDVNIKWV